MTTFVAEEALVKVNLNANLGGHLTYLHSTKRVEQ